MMTHGCAEVHAHPTFDPTKAASCHKGGMLRARAPSVLLFGLPALLLATSSPARGKETSVTLRWSAPPGCPTTADVVSEIDRLLGDRAPAEAPLEVVGIVTRDDAGRHHVRLEIAGEDGPSTREVDAASCAALGDAAALIIAMTIDPGAVAAAPPTKPSSAPPSPTATVGPASGKETSPAVIPIVWSAQKVSADWVAKPLAPQIFPNREGSLTSKNPVFAVVVRVLSDIGTLPSPTLGIGAAGAVARGRLRFELGISYFPPRTEHFGSLAAAGGDVDLFLGHVFTCVTLLTSGRIDLAPCASFEVGRIHGESFGVSSPGEGAAPWVAAGGAGRLVTRFASRTSLVTSLEAAVPLIRPEFIVTGLETLHLPTPVVVRLALGVEVRF
jgi:hypothetical protein